jgi:SHS2 domain-containing protein
MEGLEKFKFLDIAPADAAFAAHGKDRNEVFANSALAVMAIMANVAKVGASKNFKVEASGYDLKSLMFDWLSKVLYVSSTEHVLFSKFVVEVIEGAGKEEFALKATCWGEEIDLKKHDMHAEVKAITYHQMEVEEKDGKWRAQVVVDL